MLPRPSNPLEKRSSPIDRPTAGPVSPPTRRQPRGSTHHREAAPIHLGIQQLRGPKSTPSSRLPHTVPPPLLGRHPMPEPTRMPTPPTTRPTPDARPLGRRPAQPMPIPWRTRTRPHAKDTTGTSPTPARTPGAPPAPIGWVRASPAARFGSDRPAATGLPGRVRVGSLPGSSEPVLLPVGPLCGRVVPSCCRYEGPARTAVRFFFRGPRHDPRSAGSDRDSIRPQVPLRLPCYDFTTVNRPTGRTRSS